MGLGRPDIDRQGRIDDGTRSGAYLHERSPHGTAGPEQIWEHTVF